MPVSLLLKLFCLFLIVFSLAPSIHAKGEVAAAASSEAAKALPDRLGDFYARGTSLPDLTRSFAISDSEDFRILSSAARSYTSASGEKLAVTLLRTRADSSAYALLTKAAKGARAETHQGVSTPEAQLERTTGFGTARIVLPNRLAFFKGPNFVSIESDDQGAAIALASLLAATLSSGEGEIPPLVKHLPEWESVYQQAVYAVSLPALQEAVGSSPALDAITFDGGVEAVTAPYEGATRLVIAECATPQLAFETHARITQILEQQRGSGATLQLPSAYRRVGNYLVFVFNAPNESSAAQLIDKVKYEQLVQWLGDNPRAFERAQRAYGVMTANVILTTIKATGLAILLCLGAGGVVGGIVFIRRRAQATATEVYSDAGGMVRLNIDDVATGQRDPSRLLGQGNHR